MNEIVYAIYLAYVALYFILQLVVAGHILLNKNDEPVSALLWLMVVFFLPFLGILMYLFFGVNRLRTLGIKIEAANATVHRQRESAARDADSFLHFRDEGKFVCHDYGREWRSHQHAFDRMLPETKPLVGNSLELLEDGTAAYPRMLEAIKGAKSHIHLQSFIIANDGVGAMLFDALEAKAAAGIGVRVLYDRFGSAAAAMSHFFNRRLVGGGGNLEIRPFVVGNLFAPWRVQLRNHRKLLIVDGKVAFVGGVNISDANDAKLSPPGKYIHDLHCRVEGPAVLDMQFSFVRDWHYATGESPGKLLADAYFPAPSLCGDSVVRVNASGPGQNHAAAEKAFHIAAATAQRKLWIMTPYLVPDISFVKALTVAAARGVDIRLFTPRRNNHLFVRYASRSLYHNFLENGVRVFEKRGNFLHAKALLVDGEWAYLGSSNCDIRSFRLDYELDIAIAKGKVLEDLHQYFLHVAAESDEMEAGEFSERGIGVRLLENSCALLSPIL